MVNNVLFLPTTNLKLHAKAISVFRYPLSKGEDVVLCYKEGHALVLDYFIPFLKCIRTVGRATGSQNESLMVHNMSFLPIITNIKFHANMIFSAPSPAQETCFCATRKGIYY